MRAGLLLVSCSSLLLAGVLGFGKEDAKPVNKLTPLAVSILNKATVFELYSLDFEVRDEKAPAGFHGFKVLGKVSITDAEVREKLLSALQDGIAKSDGMGVFCFDPRHGIRAKFEDLTAELVICFECHQIEVFTNGKRTVFTTGDPQKIFDEVLKKAGIPLPKPAKGKPKA